MNTPKLPLILSLDPGSSRSGWCVYDATEKRVVASGDDENKIVCSLVPLWTDPETENARLVVEWFASHGQAAMGAASMCDQAIRSKDWSKVADAARMARMGATATGNMCEAAVWIGLFCAAAGLTPDTVAKLTRKDVLKAFHLQSKGADAAVRAELIAGHGGDAAIGKKANPGPLYGVAGDAWASLAVAVVYAEQLRKDAAQARAVGLLDEVG